MKKITTLVLVALAMSALAGDADAKRWKKKRHHAGAAQSEQVVPSARSALNDTTLCDGGVMITADDQIKGCTSLIGSGRLNRERKAIAFYNRGNAYVGKSDFARAISDYTDALSYKSDYAQAYFNRAVAQRVSGNPQLALPDFTAAIALNANDADAFAGRGMAYARLGQRDKALADFERAISLKPDHVVALTQRGHHYVINQNWAAAQGDYAAALSVQKTNAEALYGRGVAKVYSGEVRGGQLDMAQAQVFDSGVAARMTSLGIPPPQITEKAPETPVAAASPKASEKLSTDAPRDDAQDAARKAESATLLDQGPVKPAEP